MIIPVLDSDLLHAIRYRTSLQPVVNFSPQAKVNSPPPRWGDMTKKILTVDDDPVIRKMLRRMFDGEVDYDVCAEATNGEEVLAWRNLANWAAQ